MTSQPPSMPQSDIRRQAEDLAYWMYESSGNSKYVLAGRKPLHPDEATDKIMQLITNHINAAVIAEFSLMLGKGLIDGNYITKRLKALQNRNDDDPHSS